MADRTNLAPSHGGPFGKGNPRLIVIHDLEAPVKNGMVWDLAGGWLKTAGVSPHRMAGPDEVVATLGINTIGYHVKSPGNEVAVGIEHCGYASNTTDQWTAGAQWATLYNGARELAAIATELGIPLRWLSVPQVRDGVTRGVCTHADVSLAWGTTDHSDPGRGFPFDAYMRTAQQFAGDYTTGGGTSPTTIAPGGPGGASPATWLEQLLHWAA